jgi:hypothetical protein
MFEYRVTKYDPSKRDAQGRYLADEWIMYSQVGQAFGGVVLTMEEYERTERAYINAALSMLDECGVESLRVRALENRDRVRECSFDLYEDAVLSGDQLGEALRYLLREQFWCRLEADDGSFIHIGWDYYMYIGLPCGASRAILAAKAEGLFVEPLMSPYKETGKDSPTD